MDIRRVTRSEAVEAAGRLFDAAPEREATERFLADDRHHLLVAYVDDVPAGMVTGVEMTHPDKGTEMFLYELGVDEAYRGQGIARALVLALGRLARERGCYGLWTATGEDNEPAQATYESAGGSPEWDQVVYSWTYEQSP
ncbi:GNAT family N-acetyltransferase [Nonomuraea sp. ATR24]|uniref:GNAT family N-acetyltransferase n=1 Tax=Nonomuraea TaxID=83681 RepID=UPI001C60275B|nr:GNAT family N-acetyltransferase [Nonomuraea ceibae]